MIFPPDGYNFVCKEGHEIILRVRGIDGSVEL